MSLWRAIGGFRGSYNRAGARNDLTRSLHSPTAFGWSSEIMALACHAIDYSVVQSDGMAESMARNASSCMEVSNLPQSKKSASTNHLAQPRMSRAAHRE